MFERKLLVAIGMLLMLAALASGCGGDDDDAGNGAQGSVASSAAEGSSAAGGAADGEEASGETASTETVAKGAFLKRGNAICKLTVGKVAKQAVGPLQEAGFADKKRAEAEEELITSVLVPNLQAEVDQLRSIGTPKGDRAQVEAIFISIQEIVDRAEADPPAFVAAGPSEYNEAAKLAGQYGLAQCPFG